MAEASMALKMMRCTWGGASVGIRISLIAGLQGGCFSMSSSLTVLTDVFGRLTVV